jgi:hypothetical protein
MQGTSEVVIAVSIEMKDSIIGYRVCLPSGVLSPLSTMQAVSMRPFLKITGLSVLHWVGFID